MNTWSDPDRLRMDYHLPPIGKNCSVSGKILVPGEPCYSALIETEGRYVRVDVASDHWTGPPEQAIAYWKCVVPDSAQTEAQPLDPDALLRYFEQLCEDANPAQQKFAYVLALLLLQKRRLKIEGSRQEDGIDYLQLIGSRGEGPYEICDQHLTDEETEQLQQNLSAHLAEEWQ